MDPEERRLPHRGHVLRMASRTPLGNSTARLQMPRVASYAGVSRLRSVVSMRLRILPGFLKVSCALIAFQAASLLIYSSVGLSLTAGQRAEIDRIVLQGGGPSTFATAIVVGVLGMLMAGLVVMLGVECAFARWVTVVLELVTLLIGVVLLPVAVATVSLIG
jgi:hypothetical protein